MSNQAINWVHFLNYENGEPKAFVLLQHMGDEVWVTKGGAKTLGRREITEFTSDGEARNRFELLVEAQSADGWQRAASAHFDFMNVDFEWLRQLIRDAARLAFEACRAAAPHERMTGYTLQSDDSAMTFAAATTSAEECKRRAAKCSDDPLLNTTEYGFEEGNAHFAIPYRVVNTFHEHWDHFEHSDTIERDPADIFDEDFRQPFNECCAKAMEDLVNEGFFGAEDARQEKLISFYPAWDNTNLEFMKRLNTPAMYARFRAWYNS